MGFLDHLDELRTRIIRSCLAIGAGMLVAFIFVERIADFVLAPTLRMLPPGTTLIYTKPGEGFSFYLDVAFIGGVVLAMPFVTFQVWRFIAPALYTNEKKFVIPFVILTTLGKPGGSALQPLHPVSGDDRVLRDVQLEDDEVHAKASKIRSTCTRTCCWAWWSSFKCRRSSSSSRRCSW